MKGHLAKETLDETGRKRKLFESPGWIFVILGVLIAIVGFWFWHQDGAVLGVGLASLGFVLILFGKFTREEWFKG